jgi:hypothetical protein
LHLPPPSYYSYSSSFSSFFSPLRFSFFCPSSSSSFLLLLVSSSRLFFYGNKRSVSTLELEALQLRASNAAMAERMQALEWHFGLPAAGRDRRQASSEASEHGEGLPWPTADLDLDRSLNDSAGRNDSGWYQRLASESRLAHRDGPEKLSVGRNGKRPAEHDPSAEPEADGFAGGFYAQLRRSPRAGGGYAASSFDAAPSSAASSFDAAPSSASSSFDLGRGGGDSSRKPAKPPRPAELTLASAMGGLGLLVGEGHRRHASVGGGMERFGAYGVSPRRGGDEALETEQDLSRLTPTAFAPMGGTQTGFSQSMGQPLLGSAFSYDSAAAAAFAPLAPKPPPPLRPRRRLLSQGMSAGKP